MQKVRVNSLPSILRFLSFSHVSSACWACWNSTMPSPTHRPSRITICPHTHLLLIQHTNLQVNVYLMNSINPTHIPHHNLFTHTAAAHTTHKSEGKCVPDGTQESPHTSHITFCLHTQVMFIQHTNLQGNVYLMELNWISIA